MSCLKKSFINWFNVFHLHLAATFADAVASAELSLDLSSEAWLITGIFRGRAGVFVIDKLFVLSPIFAEPQFVFCQITCLSRALLATKVFVSHGLSPRTVVL